MPKKSDRTGTTPVSSSWRQAKELTFQVLGAASDGLEVMATVGRPSDAIAKHEGVAGLRRAEEARRRKEIRRRARELKRRGLLEAMKIGDRLIYTLTEKGEDRFLKEIIRSAPVREDGKSIVAMFDIPEVSNRARKALRGLLRTSGFRRIQLSVWHTDKDAHAAVSAWLRKRGIKKWVRVMLAKYLV